MSTNTEHKEIEPMLQFFEFSHLPVNLQPTSKAFHDLAHNIVEFTPRNPERSVALRKLLEAKDCAVRASIYKATSAPRDLKPGEMAAPMGYTAESKTQ